MCLRLGSLKADPEMRICIKVTSGNVLRKNWERDGKKKENLAKLGYDSVLRGRSGLCAHLPLELTPSGAGSSLVGLPYQPITGEGLLVL